MRCGGLITVATVASGVIPMPSFANRPSYDTGSHVLTWTGPGPTGGVTTASDYQQTRVLSVQAGNITTSANGQVIEGIALTNGWIDIQHNNVIVRQCYVHGADGEAQLYIEPTTTGTIIEDCEMSSDTLGTTQAGVGNIGGIGAEHAYNSIIRRNNLHSNEQAVMLRSTSSYTYITDNLIHSPRGFDCDMLEMYGGANNIFVDHNTFTLGPSAAGGFNSAINMTNWDGTIGPTIEITNNWFIECGSFFTICDDNSQGGGSCVCGKFQNNGFYNPPSYRRDTITITLNSGNYNMATQTSLTGTPTNGTGAI